MKLRMPPVILIVVLAFLFGGAIGQGMEQKNVKIVEKPAIEKVAVVEVSQLKAELEVE